MPFFLNAHVQTLWAQASKPLLPELDRHLLSLPDGRVITVYSTPQAHAEQATLVLPGLGGTHRSAYVQRIISALARRGHRVFFAQFQLLDHPFHSQNRIGTHAGDTEALDYIVNWLGRQNQRQALNAVGYSLGGAALLNWLAQQGTAAPVRAAAAVSVPFDLALAEARLRQGFSRVYQAYLLRCQKRQVVHGWKACADASLRRQIMKAANFARFDDLVTAPMYGFASAQAYYSRCSPRQALGRVQVPTLLIHAADDPFMTPAAIPRPQELPAPVQLDLRRHGGHVGFVHGLPWRPQYWLEERIPAFLEQQTGS